MMHNIYIDIETIPGPVVPSIDELMRQAPASYKKPESIRAWAEENQESAYRKQALDSMQGEILAIGWAHNDADPQCLIRTGDQTEGELLKQFGEKITPVLTMWKGVTPVWVGHNVKGFDLPWLWRKCIRHEAHSLARAIPRGRYNKDIEDTMEMWAIDYKDHVSLSKIADFLGIAGKTNGIDGSMVYDLWKNGEHAQIAEYCKGDVRMTRAVHWEIKLGMVA